MMPELKWKRLSSYRDLREFSDLNQAKLSEIVNHPDYLKLEDSQAIRESNEIF